MMQTAYDTKLNLKEFSKCGEIMTALEMGKKVFALNCIFCTTACMQLETFVLHIEENHSNELYAYAQDDDDDEDEQKEKEEKKEFEYQLKNSVEENLDYDSTFYKLKLPYKQNLEGTNLLNEEAEVQILKKTVDRKILCEDPLQESRPRRKCRAIKIVSKEYEAIKEGKREVKDDFVNVNVNVATEETQRDYDGNVSRTELLKKHDSDEKNLRNVAAEVEVPNKHVDTTIKCEDPLREFHSKRKCTETSYADKTHLEELIEATPQDMDIMEDKQDSYCDIDDMDDIDVNWKKLSSTTESGDTTSESELEDDNNDEIFNENDAENRDLMLALITGYEKYPILWDPSAANSKNRKKREEALKSICQVIKGKLSVTLNTKSVGDSIKKMRYKYRSELQQRKRAEERGAPLPISSWYFDQLSFLSNTIACKPRNKRGTKALSNEKPSLPLPNLTEEQNKQLIDIYKSFPCLWDMQHIGFRFKNQRMEALQKMNQAIKNKMKLHFKQDELQRKLYRIRYACTQEKHRKLQCERLNKVFRPTTKYYESIEFLLDNVGPFKCDFCEKVFNGADQYRIHKSNHDGSMPFVCPICNRGFMKVGNCTVHVRRHTRDYPFECKECGKRFATTTDVNVHMRYHTGEKPYFCEVCGRSFRTWSFFDAHMRRHQKRPSHTCTICSKAFYENNKLTEHMKAHLNVRDKVCNICGKAFTSSKYLRQHKQIHAEKKQYVCKICNKDFAQYAGLSGHMKSHGTTVSGGAVVEETH